MIIIIIFIYIYLYIYSLDAFVFAPRSFLMSSHAMRRGEKGAREFLAALSFQMCVGFLFHGLYVFGTLRGVWKGFCHLCGQLSEHAEGNVQR